MDADAVRARLQHYLDASAAGDIDGAHTVYAPDAVLEFPQSGERFDGVANFREWRRSYPARVAFVIDRVRGGGDVWVAELRVSYDGGADQFGVDVLEFRGDLVARETVYLGAPWPAPDWRAPWRAVPARRTAEEG
jgi:ketosteroid isomerase-like protein